MRIPVPQHTTDNLNTILRRLGYGPSPSGDSYVRLMRGTPYPRFHMYVNQDDRGIFLNLHLDQKRPSYQGTSAHAGEYDGEVVAAEAQRIRTALT